MRHTRPWISAFGAIALVLLGPAHLLGPAGASAHEAEAQRIHGALQDPPAFNQEWRVSPAPDLVIGVVEGADEYVFTNIFDATVLRDGTIVVVQLGRNLFEVRYFDRDGTFLTSVGRFGEGPFEFEGGEPLALGRLEGDSLLIVSVGHKYSMFGPRGEKVRSGRLPLSELYRQAYVVDRDHVAFEKWDLSPPAKPGPVTYRSLIVLLDRVTESLDTIARAPLWQAWFNAEGMEYPAPFSMASHVAAGLGTLWWGHSDNRAVRGLPMTGMLPLTMELRRPKLPVTGDLESRYKEFDFSRYGNVYRDLASYHRQMVFPDSLPGYQRLEVDVEGNLWVLAYEPPWSEEDYLWDVYSPEGAPVATVSVPSAIVDDCVRTRIFRTCDPFLEFGDDYVLLKHRDELGVARVVRYMLLKDG